MRIHNSTPSLGSLRLVALFSIVSAIVCPAPAAASPQTAASHKLTLIQPRDAEFDRLLSENFPGFDRLDGYSVFRPYLALLRNDISIPAEAYAIEWETRTSNGIVRRAEAHFVERYNPALAVDRKALAPGEIRLVSPVFDVDPEGYPKQGIWIAASIQAASMHAPYTLANIQSVTVSLDAAIFADGAYVGPDRHQLLLRYQCKRGAEKDMAHAVLKLLDQNVSTADVAAFLEKEAQAGFTANTSQVNPDSVCALYRGREAQNYLTLYHREGIERVMMRAWTVGQRRNQTISRVSLQ